MSLIPVVVGQKISLHTPLPHPFSFWQ